MAEDRIKYLEDVIELYEATRSALSVRDACRIIQRCLMKGMRAPFERLFYAIPETDDTVRFLALLDDGRETPPYSRKLTDTEALYQTFRQETPLTKKAYGHESESFTPEIQNYNEWILAPSLSPTKQVLGVLGICFRTPISFSQENLKLVQKSSDEITGILTIAQAIDIGIAREREQTIAEAAGTLLHEVMNMSGTIPVYVDMIKNHPTLTLPSELQDVLSNIQAHAREIQTETARKLDELKKRLLPDESMASDVVTLLRDVHKKIQVQEPDVDVRLEVRSGVRGVLIRQRNLSEALNNIIHNAIAAVQESDEKKIILRTSLHSHPDGRGCAKIEIEDTGCGIPAEDLDKIWNLTYTTKPSGGFGLYRAKTVIENSGGHIAVRSKVNAGTTFEILLPEVEQVRP